MFESLNEAGPRPPPSLAPSGRSVGLSKRKLLSNYHRLTGSDDAHDNDSCRSKVDKVLAAKVWKDVDRTMSPRHPERPGYFSAFTSDGGGLVCPAHFAKGCRYSVFR